MSQTYVNHFAPIQRRTMVVLAITQIIGTVGVGIAPSIGILLAEEVTSNEAWAGLARTSSTLGAALLGLPLGNLAAKFGRRFALTVGWLIAATGSFILVPAAQYSNVWALFVGLLLIGSGSAASLQSRFAATDLAEPHHKGRALSLIVWVGTIGSVLGPNLGVPGAWLHTSTGLTTYAGAFLIAAICLAAAGVIIFLALRPDPLTTLQTQLQESGTIVARPAGKNRFSMIFAELRTNRPAKYAVVWLLAAQIIMVSIMTMTPVHIAHQGGSVTIVGLTISLHVLGMYVLAPVVGIFADRWGQPRAIGIGAVILLKSLAVGALWQSETWAIITALILLGVGWSFVNVAASALFSSVVSDSVRASSQGAVDALANLFGACAAFVAGPLFAISDFSTLSVCAIVLLVGLTIFTVARAQRYER